MRGLEHIVFALIYHYRYAGLFGLLSLGMLGLPVPDEFLMTFSGFQTTVGHMAFGTTVMLAALGSFAGMNLSYWIGRKLGIPFLHKLASYLHLNEKRIATAEHWFSKYGDRLIVVGYFFPGFRHFTAYFSGMSELSYRRYVLLAGIGALIWSTAYIVLGRILGIHWKMITAILHRYLVSGGLVFGLVVLAVYIYSLRRGKADLE